MLLTKTCWFSSSWASSWSGRTAWYYLYPSLSRKPSVSEPSAHWRERTKESLVIPYGTMTGKQPPYSSDTSPTVMKSPSHVFSELPSLSQRTQVPIAAKISSSVLSILDTSSRFYFQSKSWKEVVVNFIMIWCHILYYIHESSKHDIKRCN